MSTSSSDRAGGGPPSHTRFQPGQSGNPAGRPKGSKNLRTVLERALAHRVTVTENGRQVRKTTGEVLFRRLGQDGIKGDNKAAEILLRSARDFRLGENKEEQKTVSRAADDGGVVPNKAFVRRMLKRIQHLDLSDDGDAGS